MYPIYVYARPRALLFALALFLLPHTLFAATLSLVPQSGVYTVGSTFSVGVYVESAKQAINGASGTLSFPSDKLQVVSLSKDGSIFSLWVQEPSFSNSAGTVNFEGILLNPGFIGSRGKILNVTFRVKAIGTAPITFSSGSALANDGSGTNILTGFNNAQYTFGSVAVKPQPVSTTIKNEPSSVAVSSPTETNIPTETNVPAPENTSEVVEAIQPSPIFSPEFIEMIKIFAKNIILIILLLLIIVIILYTLIRVWHAVLLMRIKLRNEAEIDKKMEVQMTETRKKLMDTEHVADSAKSELIYQQGLLLAEKAKREQVEEEVRKQSILLEEENRKHVAFLKGREASFENELISVKEQVLNTRKKLIDAEHLTEENKSNLTYQEGLLVAEKTKYEQALEETRKETNLFKEKELNVKQQLEDAKKALEEKLENTGTQLAATQKKLTETEHLAEENKSNLTYQEGLLVAEKEKNAQALEETRKETILSKERELNVKQELEGAKKALEEKLENVRTQLAATHKKLTEAERVAEENKSNLTYQEGLLVVEKTKREQVEEEGGNSIFSLREIESGLKQELKDIKIALEQELGNNDAQSAESKKKLSQALLLLEETKMQLIREQELSAMGKDEFKELGEENKKYTMLLGEKEVALQKTLNDVEILKDRELKLRENVASNEEQIAYTKNKLSDALRLAEGTRVQLAVELKLFLAEKAEHEKSVEEHKKIAVLLSERENQFAEILNDTEVRSKKKETEFAKTLRDTEVRSKEKETEFAKTLSDTEVKFKEKETVFKKKFDDIQVQVIAVKNKLADALQLAEETKTQLTTEQGLLAAEKEKTDRLTAAISKLILPNSPNPPNP